MNIPLITTGTTNHPRSVSPQINRTRSLRDKSPQDNNLLPSFGKTLTKGSYNQSSGYLKKNQGFSDAESFKVYIRARPISGKELTYAEAGKRVNIIKKEDNMIFVFSAIKTKELRPREEKSYVFDDVFDEKDTTVDIYNKVLSPALDNVLNGYNSTLLAYGMTGAGKTHTMFGDIYNSGGGTDYQPGVITLMVKDLLNSFNDEKQDGFQFQMKFSYLEIYNEQIRDLLGQQSTESLMVIEDPARGITISNLSSYEVKEYKDILELILLGNSKRVMASTNANQFSSRSHAILQIVVEKRARARDINETYTQSKLCLVDLAGSERAAGSDNRGIRQVEGANINRSLLALGNCINVLSDPNNKGAFVPYRDSKLTRLLKDSLGGNTKTMMIACISPFYMAYEETINTLKYASHARKIKKKVVKNVKEVEMHVSQYKDIIASLKDEIDILKKQLLEKRGPQQALQKSIEPVENGTQIEAVLDSLGNKLIINLEENCELSQTLKELKDLKVQNEASLSVKIKELEKSYNNTAQFAKVSQEIISLKTIMENNEVIEAEVTENLKKNTQEKKALQERILQVTYQNYLNNQSSPPHRDKSEKGVETKYQANEVCRDVPTKDKAKKDDQILALEKHIQDMQKKLEEKDKQLAHNQQLISLLHQKNENLEAEYKEITAETQTNPALSTRGYNQNFDMPEEPLSYRQKPEEPRFSFQCINEDPFGSQDKGDLKEKNMLKPLQINNMQLLEKSREPLFFNKQSLTMTSRTEEGNASPELQGKLQRNKTVVSLRSVEDLPRKEKPKKVSEVASVEELKEAAIKFQSIDFKHVQKKVKKEPMWDDHDDSSSDQNEPQRLQYVQMAPLEVPFKARKSLETENSKYNSNQSTNRNTVSQDKKFEDLRGESMLKQLTPSKNKTPEAKMLPANTFSPPMENNISSELSGIAPHANEQSLDLSAKDSLLDLYAAVKGESPQLFRKAEEKMNAYNENVPSQFNYIFSTGDSQDQIPSTNQNGPSQANYTPLSQFAPNPTSNYQPSLNNYKLGFMMRTGAQENFNQQSYNGQIPSNVNGTSGYSAYSPNAADVQRTSNSANTQKTEESNPKRSSSTIRNLGSAREFIKSFRMRVNVLMQAAENNKLSKNSIPEITQLVQDYHNNQNFLTANDFTMLRNLGAMALQKVQKEQEMVKVTHHHNARSVSANSRARHPINPSADIAAQSHHKSPMEVRKKSPEESKPLKKTNPASSTKSKTGILSNINSDYSKALNKFCKTPAPKPKAEVTKQSATKSVSGSQIMSGGTMTKNLNEYNEKERERGRNQAGQSRKKSPNEVTKGKELNSRENQVSAFEMPSFEHEGKQQNIIDQNGAQMKMKMKNIRDKFEQIQKQNALKNMSSPFKDLPGGSTLQQSGFKPPREQVEDPTVGSEGS